MRLRVVPIQKARRQAKAIAANQKAVDALPFKSGTWRIRGVSGLFIRCRAKSKSFYVQRRVQGELVKRTLGELPVKQARDEAMREWSKLKPLPAGRRKTLAQAFHEFIEQGGKRGELAESTQTLYRYNFERHLAGWKDRALTDIGEEREGARALYSNVARKHGKAVASQVLRMFAAVYRHARRANLDLPECPAVAVTMKPIKARDWAMSQADLKVWWAHTAEKNGTKVERGVKTLNAIKRTWWLTCLFTGARRGSVEALEWRDIDLEKRTIRFRVAKGDRPYIVPASDKLVELLTAYRDSGEAPPSAWVFPSPIKPGGHLTMVRNDKKGVASAHHLRHTFRTTLVELGATSDQARLLMGHSMGGDVSRGYITAPLLVESLRPVANAVAARYIEIVGPLEV